MSNLAKLSKQAVQLEHDRQFDKALALYARLFDEAAADGDEVDVALYNRAGDVAMRLGDSARAVGYFERAIDAYASGGLLNNAIAVCNKLLRQAPEHAATHYTLAVLHAKQGFRGDAKYHFVEYADRMHRAGRDDEALRALTEFAALCPAGDDARAALARHLAKGNRGTELAAKLEAMLPAAPEIPDEPAETTAAPTAATTVSSSVAPVEDDRGRDLVFLDVSLDSFAASVAPVAGLELTSAATDLPAYEPSLPPSGTAELEPGLLVEVESPMAPVDDVTWGGDAPQLLDVGEPDDLDLGSFGELPLLDDAEEAVASTIDTFDAGMPDTDALDLAPLDLAPVDLAPMDADALEPEPLELEMPEADPTLQAPIDLAPAELEPVAFESMTALDAMELGTAQPASTEPAAMELAAIDFDAPDLPTADPADPADAAFAAPEVSLEPERVEPERVEPEPVEPEPVAMVAVAEPAPRSAATFVDLGDWLRADEPTRSTRITTEDVKPTGDEAADFERMLDVFKAGLARNVEATDHASHYDLGVAFREMGLIEEAIGEFQRAARAPAGALRAREALGQCFLDRGSPELAIGVLERALDEATATGAHENELALLGVVYLLGEAHARLGQHKPARACFQRVVTADIDFRDAARRLTQLPAPTP